MKRIAMVSVKPRSFFLCLITAVLLVLCTSCIYMKMDPPPDVDKGPPPPPPPAIDNSCWEATASNMLAAAGYGSGNTVQARSDDIYGDMVAQYGKANGGWADSALTWWLSSTNNTWANNPYTVVTVYGNKTKNPWANPNGARDIGNELRDCNYVGLSISWPPDTTHANAYGGHAITAWGDYSGNRDSISSNPAMVRLVDSDRDTGGDVQSYSYDSYTNPNPGGNNSGNGWYINYSANHPFIKHIVTLSPVAGPSGGKTTQKVLGSYKIHQGRKVAATDLHYTAGTDVEILSYRTWLDWSSDESPIITEADPRRSIKVDWDLSQKPVPFCKWVTITTEFILPRWNALSYSDVRFTYPRLEAEKIPGIHWSLDTPRIRNAAKIVNVTGGYVVGSFAIVDPKQPEGQAVVGQYRFIHQYSYDQSPESHVFTLRGGQGYRVTNLQFGHSYGYLDNKALWEFRDWMTKIPEKIYKLGDEPIKVDLDWKGRLPYPEGEIVPWGKDPKKYELYKRP